MISFVPNSYCDLDSSRKGHLLLKFKMDIKQYFQNEWHSPCAKTK